MKRRGNTLQDGFTLIELMVSIFLAGLVIVAAFHIHTTFQSTLNRQQGITRMQQTMKVTREILVSRIRGSGGGVVSNVWTGCGGERPIGPFVLHNANALGSTDLSEGGQDNDPDWFEIMAVDYNSSGTLSQKKPVTGRTKPTDQAHRFRPGDLVLVQNEHGACLLMVSSVSNNWIKHQSAGQSGAELSPCYNTDLQICRRELQVNQLEAGTPLLNIGRRSAAFRVDDSDPKRPLLMMASGQIGGDPTQYDWQPIAEGVEDMQIAVHLDTDTPPDAIGDIWVNSRDLHNNETGRVRAVRLSVVFRSIMEIPGWTQGLRPGLEDRPASTGRDGFIRRTFTTIIKLRNMPQEATP